MYDTLMGDSAVGTTRDGGGLGRRPQQSAAAVTPPVVAEAPRSPAHQPTAGFLHELACAAAGSRTADWQAKLDWVESLRAVAVPPAGRVGGVAAAAAAGGGGDAAAASAAAICARAASCPDAAARLAWLRHRDYTADAAAAQEAVRTGNAAALTYLLDEAGVRLGEDLSPVRAAAQGGKLEVLRALRSRRLWMDPYIVALAAAAHGHLPVVQWAVQELGASVREGRLKTAAASSGSVELMAWLQDTWGCRWTEDAFAASAGSGCEEAVEWLAENGCPMGTNGQPYNSAVGNNDLAVLRCLARLGCPWGASGGAIFACCLREPCKPLPLLRGLVEAGCPVDWQAAVDAASRQGSAVPAEIWHWLVDEMRHRQH
ncbi:hypothetical protein GPECTOR_31g397 [Gonium pectorale]|uniref:Ankyrin repeat domain-containing protein n=1 Tax=Gonium pectorale TaxID=33097 RepID=A0A150GE31_GONPE|nr:hypothetical protein GPECTOR_31g397 [Gonium pectorale]|eukprot:KXZ48033.1 hypothetical protein GPECTOR_31g397 [Gonium pectorale]